MPLSDKQLVYQEILWRVLPIIRTHFKNQNYSVWIRLRKNTIHREAQFIHNIPVCLVDDEFTDADFHWLNSPAKVYCEQPGAWEDLKESVARLFDLVPAHLRDKLEWPGP